MGITIGRLLSGFVAIKLSSPTLIRVGQGVGLCGILLLFLPLPQWRMPLGLCLIGGGCAPIFPAMLHQTPQVFGKKLSQAMMGVQMACSYVGSMVIPPLFGFLADFFDVRILPAYLLLFLASCSWARKASSGAAGRAGSSDQKFWKGGGPMAFHPIDRDIWDRAERFEHYFSQVPASTA